ncbi:putative bromo domain containing protein [Lyophyllum shimeji]|uniref:histone acetyltransferase n=1 Tax=Lyophyllum shimeji TaxID=47721 RepID=A0A9P3UNS6_LYOSH|nr:putative bromo domain containing protein [Lyophyllum shimeji]
MKFAYPASDQISQLNSTQRALKVARHSPCATCKSCAGLHPPPGVDVVLDQQLTNESSLGDLGQYGSDADDDDSDLPYLDTCACGHDVVQHNADESEIGPAEFARRSRVAIRLDELLHDHGRLLDFAYLDEEISSLRRQMRISVSLVSPAHTTSSPEQRLSSVPLSPASSALSDPPQPPNKRRRISISSLSDADDDDDDDDDEEDKPLAARMADKTSARPEKTSRAPASKRGGKSRGKQTQKAQTAPTSVAPPTGEEQAQMNGKMNGVNGYESKVKVEDIMDENQLTRLAAGVTVDTAARASAGPPTRTEKAATIELRKGIIQVTPVENDGQPRSLVILAGLKTLFQKQLPNMPREYIARLVLDANSRGLAIIKRGYKVVGGICFRPFPHRGFAEIVFFATASADQEKGYGGMLMDYFKAHVKKTYPGMMHFLTYADNYAVGYFEKQGFSKDITLDRSVWAAYIKDYEGGTIMQCTMLRKVDYLDKPTIFAQQQEAVMTKIRQMSRSHIVYSGLPQFQPGAPEGVTVDPKDVPGLRESGWTVTMALNEARPAPRNTKTYRLERMLKELKGHPSAWPFLTPVNGDEVTDYYDVIKNPMDFSTMEHKLETNQYPTMESFVADAQLVFDNCKTYNPEQTIYHKLAVKLEMFLETLVEKARQEG